MAETNRERITRIDCETDDLANRLAKLEQTLEPRVTAIEGKVMREETVAEMPEYIPFDSVKRNSRGEIETDPDLPSYDERQAARRESDRKEAAEIKALRTKGLPHGYWRDPTGIVRNQSGWPATDIESDRIARQEADAELAVHQRKVREEADKMFGKDN